MMMKKTAKLFTVVLVVCAMLMSIIATTLVSAEEANLPEAIDGEVTSVETFETEEPAAEEPEAEEPAAEEPAAEEPAADEPVAEEPVANEPVADEPAADEPVVDEPVADEPVANEPVADEPVANEPVADEPVANEPVANEPVADEPVAKEPVVDEPVVSEPVVEEPVVEEPVVEEPVVEEPVVEEAEDEEAEDEETVEFSCELTAKLENEGDIIEGQQIVLNATVLNANMEFSFRWQRTPVERNADEEEIWTDISNVFTYTFDATENADDYFYRATVTAEDGTVICSERISFDVLPAEEIITSEPETEEAGDAESADAEPKANEEPMADEEPSAEGKPVAEEAFEGDEAPQDTYENKTIVLGDEETGIVVREGADSQAASFTTLSAGAEVTVLRQDGDWVMVFANNAYGFIHVNDLAGYLGLAEIEDYETPLGIPGKIPEFDSESMLTEQDLPENALLLAEILDELNEDRSVNIYMGFEGEELRFGDEVTLYAVLNGYDDCVFTVQWQISPNDEDEDYTDIDGENELTCSFVVTEENYTNYWRIVTTITAVNVPDELLKAKD